MKRTSKSTSKKPPKADRPVRATSRGPDLAAEIDRVKQDLLSLVSHELRTPLSSVLNALRMLREEELPLVQRQSFLDMAQRNAELLNSKLSQMLDLSRLVSGRLVCKFQEVSLRNLVTGLIDRLINDTEAAGLQIEVGGTGRMGPWSPELISQLPVVLADGTRLEQVISGVFDNAVKFSPPHGKLSLRLRSGVKGSALPAPLKAPDETVSNEFIVLEVSNAVASGSRDEHSDLFRVFSQGQSVLTREQEGLGGSLAIAAEVLRQHGGVIHASKTPADERERFTVVLAFPVLENESALMKVVESRMYALKNDVGALSLIIFDVDQKSVKQVYASLRQALFRASDTVYTLPEQKQVAVLLDDCKKSDAPKIVQRLVRTVGAESGKFLEEARVGYSSCPEDTTDPVKLLQLARAKLESVAGAQ